MIEKLKKSLAKGTLNVKGLIAFMLFGAIVLVFVFFGMPTQTTGVGAAAEVNNTLISFADLQKESSRMEQMYGQFLGGLGGAAQRQFLQSQALESLITAEVMFQSAEAVGVLATDAEVRDVLVNEIPAFKRDGLFQRDLYLAVLQANSLTPGDFEKQVRKERASQRIRKLFEASEFPLEAEVQKVVELKGERRKLSFVKLSRDAFASSSRPSRAQAQEAFKDSDFVKRVEDYYNSNKSDYTAEAKVKARHILFKSKEGQSSEELLKKAQEIKAQLTPGNFAELAKKHSEDEGSRGQGGDLGEFGRGRMVPEFEAAAFSQAIGVVGEPVKSDFGYHLILVESREDSKLAPLGEVREQVAQKVLGLEAYDRLTSSIEAALSSGDQKALEGILGENKLSWKTTPEYTADTTTIPELASPVATEESLQLSQVGQILPKLVRDGTDRFILKLASSQRDNGVDAGRVREEMAQMRSIEFLNQWVDQSRKAARVKRNEQALR